MPSIPNHKTSSAAPTALVYITIGALVTVWSAIWFLYEQNTPNASKGVNYVCAGLLLTGVALLAIGFGIGAISRKAQAGEMAAEEHAARSAAIEKDPSLAQKV